MNISDNIEQQCTVLHDTISQTLDLAKCKSVDTEVSIMKIIGINVNTRYGKLQNIQYNNDSDLTINVYNKNHSGIASSNNLTHSTIANILQTAIDIAKYTSYDPHVALADYELLAFEPLNLNLYHPWEIDTNQAINMCVEAEQTALSIDNRITNTEGSTFNAMMGVKVFGNSHGMLQSYCFSRYWLSCIVIAEQDGNMERYCDYTINTCINELDKPERVGMECARRALSRLSPRKLSTMKSPVIFSRDVAYTLFNHLVNAINGINVYRGSTFLMNLLGKKIFPEWLTIKENPHLLKALASAPFDNEGVRTKVFDIVRDGILQTWLLNSYSGRKLGLKSTGHAGGIYNWFVCGKISYKFDDILKKMWRGLLVTEIMGHGVSVITGNYSRGVSGYWVDNGEIQYPVNEITIANNLKNMWLNIEMLGSDIETRHDIRCGSILLPEMQIAGK